MELEDEKKLASWLMAEIDSFAEYKDGKIGLYTLCRILAKSVLNFRLAKDKDHD